MEEPRDNRNGWETEDSQDEHDDYDEYDDDDDDDVDSVDEEGYVNVEAADGMMERDDDDNEEAPPPPRRRSRKRKTRDGEENEEEGNGLGIHMVISSEERSWAVALKAALEEGEDTYHIPISDMELVQHAMVERGNIEKAIDRIKKMHEFRTKYQLQDTVEHGLQSIANFMKQQPGFSLNLDQCARHKHFVHVMDFAKFNPKRVNLPEDWKVFLSGMHYFMSALNPTLSAVRNGVLGIMECDGMGWHNFCMDFERRLWHEHANVYPARFHELSWVRTPLVANVFFSLLKPIMAEEVRKVVHLGVKFDESFDGRLDELFLQPSVEIANQRQLMTAKAFLEKRYHNEKHFRL